MENFDSSISNGDKGKWIVFYGSPWCPHCKVFAPVYKEFAIKASKKKNGVNYGAVNCELQNDVCHSQKVKMYPTVFFYSEGYKYALNGKRTEETLLSFIERYNVDNKKYPIALANKDAKTKVNDQDKKSENTSTKTIATPETKSSKPPALETKSSKASTPKTADTSKAPKPKTADTSKASTPKTADTSKAPKPKTADTSKALVPKTDDSSKAPTPKTDDTKTRLAQKETIVVAFNKTHYFMMFFVLFLVVFIVYLVILPMLKKWIFRTSADDIAEQVQEVKCFEGFGSSNQEEDTEETIGDEI